MEKRPLLGGDFHGFAELKIKNLAKIMLWINLVHLHRLAVSKHRAIILSLDNGNIFVPRFRKDICNQNYRGAVF